MALKIVLLALLVYCTASEAQSQGNDTSLSYDVTELQGDYENSFVFEAHNDVNNNYGPVDTPLFYPLFDRILERSYF